MAKFKTTAGESVTHDSLEPMRTRFQAGSLIFMEEDLGLAMYVIEVGEVEIRKHIGGEDRVLATLGKGDFFGEMCMLEEETPRTASAVARTDVEAVMIDQSAFTFILMHNPEIAIRMMRKLTVRLRQTTKLLEEALADLNQEVYANPYPAAVTPPARPVPDHAPAPVQQPVPAPTGQQTPPPAAPPAPASAPPTAPAGTAPPSGAPTHPDSEY